MDLKFSERRFFRLEEPRGIRAGFYADYTDMFGLRQIYGSDDPRRLGQIYPASIFMVQRTLLYQPESESRRCKNLAIICLIQR